MPKRRTALKLLLEFAAIVSVMAGAAIGIYYGFRSPPIHDKLPLGGRNVDISRSEDTQFEASVASDPRHPRRLLAASMDGHIDARIYRSIDAGRTWTSSIAPPEIRAPCGFSHPSVAVGRGDVEVAARIGRYNGVYGVDLVAGRSGELFLAVSDGRGARIVVQRSTNGGSSWVRSRVVARLAQPYVVGCGAGSTQVAALPQHCVSAIARLAVSGDHVAVAYADPTIDERSAVFTATSNRVLSSPFHSTRVASSEPRDADRFLPTIAYDRMTGALWTCYYDTYGDPTRKHAWYTCTVSRDG